MNWRLLLLLLLAIFMIDDLMVTTPIGLSNGGYELNDFLRHNINEFGLKVLPIYAVMYYCTIFTLVLFLDFGFGKAFKWADMKADPRMVGNIVLIINITMFGFAVIHNSLQLMNAI